jgi:pimeloyl-ACP methyl ester carboxylesterase
MRGRSFACRLAAVVIVVAAMPSMTSSASARGPSGAQKDASTEISWRPCTEAEIPDSAIAMDCATVAVPVDYEQPNGRTLSLFVSRHRSTAANRIGPLFVNQGGPGMEAAIYANRFVATPGVERFDIIGMDPRGTGRSTHLKCRSDLRKIPEFAVNAEGEPTQRTEDAVAAFTRSCAEDPNHRFFGSNNAARDMDRLRGLLGADKITYFGKSYGSDLGTAYLSLFPDRVRAAVFDGATDLTLDMPDFIAQQARAAREAFDRYLQHCAAETCAWTQGKDPRTAWDRLVRQLTDKPVKIPDSDDSLTAQELRSYADGGSQASGFEEIDEALDALVVRHDPSGLLSSPLDDESAAIGAAFLAVTCLDTPVNNFDAALRRLRTNFDDPSADHIGVLLLCSHWPKPADPIKVRRAPDSARVAVVSTRGDVPTPYESGVGLSRALGVPLLTWEANASRLAQVGNMHTAYTFSPCVRQLANRMLVDLEPLAIAGASCPYDFGVDIQTLTTPEPDPVRT